jgi:hypothetical protein
MTNTVESANESNGAWLLASTTVCAACASTDKPAGEAAAKPTLRRNSGACTALRRSAISRTVSTRPSAESTLMHAACEQLATVHTSCASTLARSEPSAAGVPTSANCGRRLANITRVSRQPKRTTPPDATWTPNAPHRL